MSRAAPAFQRPQPLSVKYHHNNGADEILRPTLMTVSDGRCYRKLTDVAFGPRRSETQATHHFTTTSTTETTSTGCEEPVSRQPLFTDDVYDEGEDMTPELEGLEQIPGGGYTLRLPIHPVFFKYIIGQGGKTKSNVEKDTKCRIRVPGKGRSGDIIVEGQTVLSVAEAKRRLEMIVWSNRNKEPITHFLSIPLNVKNVIDKFNHFKKNVLLACKEDSSISEVLFQVEEKLHLTCGVMRLFSQEEESKAKELFKGCVKEARVHLGTEPAVISLRGVECMKDDPSAVDVLYAQVKLTDSSDRLQKFVDDVVQRFREKAPELMPREFERDGVKLHATLMNSGFRLAAESKSVYRGVEGRLPQSVRKYLKKKPFNATKIFKDFGDFDFGEVRLEVVHLSQRGEVGPDGYYRCIDHIALNS